MTEEAGNLIEGEHVSLIQAFENILTKKRTTVMKTDDDGPTTKSWFLGKEDSTAFFNASKYDGGTP